MNYQPQEKNPAFENLSTKFRITFGVVYTLIKASGKSGKKYNNFGILTS